MTRQQPLGGQPIRFLDELGAELSRVAAAEQERRPGVWMLSRRWVTYPGARARSVAIALVAVIAMSGIAYAIPATRTILGDVVGWVAGGDDRPSRQTTSDGDQASGQVSQQTSTTEAGQAPRPNVPPGVPVEDRNGVSLSGDHEAARASVVMVDDFYSHLASAVVTGVSATDVPVGDTIAAGAENVGLANACKLMSERSRRETIYYAKRSSGYADLEWSCEGAMALLLRRTERNEGITKMLNVELIGVNVIRNHATATVRFGKRGRLSTIPLEKEDGAWKFGVVLDGNGL